MLLADAAWMGLDTLDWVVLGAYFGYLGFEGSRQNPVDRLAAVGDFHGAAESVWDAQLGIDAQAVVNRRADLRRTDRVVLHVTNVEQAQDATHGFAIDNYNVNLSLEPGETQVVRFTADKAGVFPFYCTEFCSALHLEMQGWLIVEPK